MVAQSSAAPPAPEPAPGLWVVMRRLAVVVLLVVLDLWSKAAVFAWLTPRPEGMQFDVHGHLRWPVFGDWFGFMLSYNPGMAWGIDAIPQPVLVGGRVLAGLFLLWLLVRAARARWSLAIALTLILAGALGNLYDNLFLDPRRAGARFGEVRDFIDVYFVGNEWHFPTFNVADSCITVGAVFLLLSSIGIGDGGSQRGAEAVDRA